MRLMMIVCCHALFCCSAASAQRIQTDSLTNVVWAANASDSATAPALATFRVSYPVLRHSLYGTLGGAALMGTVFGVLSVVCTSPNCPKMGAAITYGIAFGALSGGAVGAVSGLNTPVRKPTAQRAAD